MRKDVVCVQQLDHIPPFAAALSQPPLAFEFRSMSVFVIVHALSKKVRLG